MALYESVIIGRQDLTVSQLDTLIDEFITVLKSQEGDVKKREYWGLRNLAYKINKNRSWDRSSREIAEAGRERVSECVL